MKNKTEQLFPYALLYGIRVSKVTRPIVPDGVTVKPRHEALLQQPQKADSHIVLASAPAGYGKTTLVAAWLSGIEADIIWLTLDKGDNDPIHFFKGIVAAFVHQIPAIQHNISSLIELPLQTGGEAAAEMIAYEIEQADEKQYFVLDDIHTIENPVVLSFFQHLIDILPDNLCIILLSRSDPKLKLANQRLRNRVTEIRVEDLRLNRDEVKELLEAKTGIALSDETLTSIEVRTEGWLAGVQLLGIALHESSPEDIEGFLGNFFASHRYVVEYLVEEILNQLPTEIVDFMYSSSLFNFFSAEVCDEVFGYTKSAETIDTLTEYNLLIHPIDEPSHMYQYHPLLRNYLRSAGKKKDSDKYIAGAEWFERKGFVQESLRLAVGSGNEKKYIISLTREAERLFTSGEHRSLVRWLNHLPEEFYARNPHFHVYRVWSLLLQGNKTEAEELAETLLNNNELVFDNKSLARIDCLLVLTKDCQDTAQYSELLMELEKHADQEDRFIWILAKLIGGNLAFHNQNHEEAQNQYTIALEEAKSIDNYPLIICSVFNLSFAFIQDGKWNKAKSLCVQELSEGEAGERRNRQVAELLYLPLIRILRKSEMVNYPADMSYRGEQAFRFFSFGLLLNQHVKVEIGKNGQQQLQDPLSKREIDVLRLIAKGYSNADISESLFISVGTVKWHINNIFSKLDSKNRTQAVLKAEEHKLI